MRSEFCRCIAIDNIERKCGETGLPAAIACRYRRDFSGALKPVAVAAESCCESPAINQAARTQPEHAAGLAGIEETRGHGSDRSLKSWQYRISILFEELANERVLAVEKIVEWSIEDQAAFIEHEECGVGIRLAFRQEAPCDPSSASKRWLQRVKASCRR